MSTKADILGSNPSVTKLKKQTNKQLNRVYSSTANLISLRKAPGWSSMAETTESRESQHWIPGLVSDMGKIPYLKFSQVPGGLPAHTSHCPGVPHVPSVCSRPWKKAVGSSVTPYLKSTASCELTLGTQHVQRDEESGRGQACGQDCLRQT